MVHLVTCLLRGARLNPQGLEPQLQQALMQLEPLELLASEREASRSRSASPVPPVAQMEIPQTQPFSEVPEFQSAWNAEAQDGGNLGTDFQDFGNDFGNQNVAEDFMGGGDGDVQGFGGDWPEGEAEKSKKDKKEKKKKKDRFKLMAGSQISAFIFHISSYIIIVIYIYIYRYYNIYIY